MCYSVLWDTYFTLAFLLSTTCVQWYSWLGEVELDKNLWKGMKLVTRPLLPPDRLILSAEAVQEKHVWAWGDFYPRCSLSDEHSSSAGQQCQERLKQRDLILLKILSRASGISKGAVIFNSPTICMASSHPTR